MTKIRIPLRRIKVIITVPHGFCIISHWRNCDLLASQFAMEIKNKLSEFDIDSTALFARFPRYWKDGNREESRDTRFRKMIDESLASLEPSNTILIDVHSAPKNALKKHYIDNFDIYLLDIDGLSSDNAFNESLAKYLSDRGILTYKLRGALDNDIVVKALIDFNLSMATLIEINETINNDRMNAIAGYIARHIKENYG